jgi:hypothetical protein
MKVLGIMPRIPVIYIDIKKIVMNISCYSLIKLFEHMTYDLLHAYYDHLYCAYERALYYIEYGLWWK